MERIDPDVDYGFPYTIEWEASEFDQEVPLEAKKKQIDRKIEWLCQVKEDLANSTLPEFENLDLTNYTYYDERYFVIGRTGNVITRHKQRPKALESARWTGRYLLDRREGKILNIGEDTEFLGILKTIKPNKEV